MSIDQRWVLAGELGVVCVAVTSPVEFRWMGEDGMEEAAAGGRGEEPGGRVRSVGGSPGRGGSSSAEREADQCQQPAVAPATASSLDGTRHDARWHARHVLADRRSGVDSAGRQRRRRRWRRRRGETRAHRTASSRVSRLTDLCCTGCITRSVRSRCI